MTGGFRHRARTTDVDPLAPGLHLADARHITPRMRTKYEMVVNHLGSLPPSESWFVGDTDTDILAGKELGCRTIGVLSGIRNRQYVAEAKPDFIVADVRSVIGVVRKVKDA